MHVRWRGLDPAEWEGFDWSVRAGHHSVNHHGFIEALCLQIVHQVIGVIRAHMASPALSFAEKDFLSTQLGSAGFLGIKFAVDVQFGRGGEIKNLLELSHIVNLAAAIKNVDAFLCGYYRVTIEIRCALLELSKIFNGLEGTLGPEETLNVHPTESRCLDSMAELLRANVTNQMGGAIRAAIGMAVKAGHTKAWLFGATIFGRVELLLRKGRQQQTKAFQLFGIKNAVEYLVVVVDRDEFSLGNIPEVRARGQINCRRKR